MDWDDLPALFPELTEPGRWLPALREHARLIAEAAPRVNVSSIEPAAIVRRQYAESLETWRLTSSADPIGDGTPKLVDVGSGGGFPGMVIAIVRPDLEVHLVEPLRKRAGLLAEIAAHLGLANVSVHAERAEEAGRGPLRESASIAMARAVADVRELVEYLAPLARSGAWLVMPKGSRVTEQLDAAAAALAELGCRLKSIESMRPEIADSLSVVVLEKVDQTKSRYPRRPGIPRKRPL